MIHAGISLSQVSVTLNKVTLKLLAAFLLLQFTDSAFAQDAQLLSRVRDHMKETIDGVPNYTCQQLIERFKRVAGNNKKLEKLDALRLDVAVVNKRELFAWPGQNHFQETDLNEFSKNGAFGTGNFVTHLANALGKIGVSYTIHGEEDFEGKKAYRFGYTISAARKPYAIKIGPNSGIAGVKGQFWVDVKTLDVLRLELSVTEIPGNLGVLQTKEFVEYLRVKIGGGDFLLPKRAELQLEFNDGQLDQNKTTFSACRQYSGESTIRFDDAVPTTSELKPPEEIVIPSSTQIYVEFKEKLSSLTAAVGDPIEVIVLRPVKVKGKVIISKGAVISGRLNRMERTVVSGTPIRIVGFEFNKLTAGNQFANLKAGIEEGGSVMSSRFPNRLTGSRQRILVFWEPNGRTATAVFTQGNTLELGKGFLIVLRTE